MKSELILTRKVAELKYPLLAAATQRSSSAFNGVVVLFTDSLMGVVVKGNASIPLGFNNEGKAWVPVTNSLYWDILPTGSQVVLTQ